MKPSAFAQKLPWVIILLVLPLMGYSQYIRNAANSNYGALQSVAYNPANLVDSRYRFAMTPISVYADANNNYVNIRTPYSQVAALRNNLPDYLIDSNGYPLFENSYVEERLIGNDKQAYVSADVMGPSFLFGLNDKSGIAFTTRTRMAVSMNNLNEDLLKLFMEDYDTNYPGYSPNRHQLQYLNDRNTQVKFGAGPMAWQDPKPAPAPGNILTPEDVLDLMNFGEFDYYLILGAYKNKPLADELVKRLNREAGILTYVYYDEVSQMNYVTFGRVDNRSKANENLRLLKRPAVDRIIIGHVWWKKQPK